MIVKYENSIKKEISLIERPYRLILGELFDYEYDIDESGCKIEGFGNSKTKSKLISIDVFSHNGLSAKANLSNISEIFNQDVLTNKPGRIWVNDWYLPCFIYGRESEFKGDDILISSSFKLKAEKLEWIKETTKQFLPSNTSVADLEDTVIKKYPYSYPYVYDYTSERQELQNLHFTDCDFEIIIYGPVINPTVVIDGHIYQVDCKLDTESEHIKINSYTKTVCKVYADGTEESVYEYRNRDYYIYEPIPSGIHSVSWNGSFGFDITLIAKRSEPSWT